MKVVTRNNLIKLVELMKSYQENKNPDTLEIINSYIDNVINKDSSYFSKLQSYNLDNETLKYLM